MGFFKPLMGLGFLKSFLTQPMAPGQERGEQEPIAHSLDLHPEGCPHLKPNIRKVLNKGSPYEGSGAG